MKLLSSFWYLTPDFRRSTIAAPSNFRVDLLASRSSTGKFFKQQSTVKMSMLTIPISFVFFNGWGYRGGSPTAVQAWRPCALWEPSPSHPIVLL